MFVLAIGCGAPAAPTHPAPLASPPPPAAHPSLALDAQLASWTLPAFDGPAMAVAAARPERCSLRVTARGVTVDGERLELDDAIAICAQRTAVLVEVEDGADPALWPALDAAFAAAKVPVLHRGVRGHDLDARSCATDPLARGCL